MLRFQPLLYPRCQIESELVLAQAVAAGTDISATVARVQGDVHQRRLLQEQEAGQKRTEHAGQGSEPSREHEAAKTVVKGQSAVQFSCIVNARKVRVFV
jgi:hypothetical protein